MDSDLAVTAPRFPGFPSRATSSPCPYVPEAVTTGFGSVRGPSRQVRSTAEGSAVGRRRLLTTGGSQRQPELSVEVVLLQGADAVLLGPPFGDAGGGGQRGGDGGEAGDAVGAGGEPDVG